MSPVIENDLQQTTTHDVLPVRRKFEPCRWQKVKTSILGCAMYNKRASLRPDW